VLVSEDASAGVGGGGAVCGFVSAAGAGAGGARAVGLGAGRGPFFRFTVFLLTSFLSSSWATFSPTYRLSQIADKALIFDGNITLRRLRSGNHVSYNRYVA